MSISEEKIDQAKNISNKHGGIFRTSDAIKRRNSPQNTVASKVKSGVICLISALSFHEITTQIPHEVYTAISRNMAYPKLSYPPTLFFRFSDDALNAEIEIYKLSGVDVRIYSLEKPLWTVSNIEIRSGLMS